MATGNRTVVVCATTGWVGRITSVDPGELSRPSLDDSDLSTIGFAKFVPGDLVDPGEMQLEFFFDPDSPAPPIDKPPELVTIQYAPPAGKTNGATRAGQAFFTKSKPGAAKNNEQIQGGATLKWSGAPTYTPSS